MRIVFLGNYVQDEKLSGPEKVAKRLFNEVYSRKIDCVYLEYFFKEYPDSNLFNRVFGYKHLINSPSVIRAGIFPCIIFLLKYKSDVIHIITFKRYIIIILVLKKLFHSKIVTTLHGINRYEFNLARKRQNYWSNLKDRILEKLIFTGSDLIVFLSNQQREVAKQYYKLDEKKVKILPNGIDPIFNTSKNIVNKSGRAKIIFYNGYSHEVKGSKIFFDVLSKLRQKGFDFEIYLFGDKPIQNLDENIIIKYVPYFKNRALAKFMADKHIYINTAFYEPFSLFAVEAMAAGLIVIVSSNVGMNRYIEHGKNGFIYNCTKQDHLEKILEAILTNKIDMNLISHNASLIYEQLNWELVTNLYINSFNQILNKNP